MSIFFFFCSYILVFFSTRLRFVHSMLGLWLAWWCFNNVWVNFVNVMLGLRLAWVHKIYHKTKVFSKKVKFSNKWSLNSPFLRSANSLLGLWLAWCCFNKVWVNFLNCHVGSPICLISQSLPQNQNISKIKNINK